MRVSIHYAGGVIRCDSTREDRAERSLLAIKKKQMQKAITVVYYWVTKQKAISVGKKSPLCFVTPDLSYCQCY